MSEIHTLENGLRVVADPMPSLETVAVGVWAHAGAVDEHSTEHGLAHLLEHMAFKGTTRRSARAIAEEIETIGGYLNAATSHQRTGYYARLLKDDLTTGLDVLADILQDPLFDEGELTKEKDVVVQEIGEVADTPDDVVFELLQEATWDGHPLARSILGTAGSVRMQSPATLKAFLRRHYQPANMVVAAAGNVDPQNLFRLAEDLFGAMRNQEARAERTTPVFKSGVRHNNRDIEQTHLALALPGVSAQHEDFFATRVFADALGGGMSSRLFQIIREEQGLAYSVYAFADGYEACGLTGAYLGADADQIAKAAVLIRAEIEDMAANASDDEINRARALLRSSFMMSLENPASRIEAAAGQLFTYGKILSAAQIAARLDAVSLEDVKRCASRALEGDISISMVGHGDTGPVEKAFAA